MRLIIDILVALTLLGMLAGITLHYRAERNLDEAVGLAESEVQRFQSQIMLQAALESGELTEFGYPASVDPVWFGDNLPRNPLLGEQYPWVEIADEKERGAEHPRLLMADSFKVAQFWYNPYTGVVRARVPGDMSAASATELYNRVNGTSLKSLIGTAH